MTEINDKHEIFKIYEASCSNCKNGFEIFGFTCKAFPKGIPDEILTAKNKHLTPLPDQGNAIVFESIEP